ncbi:MAG: hypothetical protein JWO79_4902 [Actinomycetia bacterium]|jgi:hypothetical protein|nr:hypothetical protein [Actinomycetes bacterium]MDQ1657822.1 hypothetical protein [Cryptosporangiaceae bacterium]
MTPETLERTVTLATAVARFDELRTRDSLASAAADYAREFAADPAAGPADLGPPPLTAAEALEMLALGEVIARKAAYGRQLGVRSARAAGASWSQVGDAIGVSKQSAWEAHSRWLGDDAVEPADD